MDPISDSFIPTVHPGADPRVCDQEEESHMLRKTSSIKLLAPVLALGLALSACGSSDSEGSSKPNADAPNTYGLPSDYVGGKVKIGTSVGLAPYEVFGKDGKTIEGYEPDILNEIGKRLGVKLDWTAAKFETIMPGVNAGRYDIAVNGIFNNEERAAEYDLLNYFGDSATFLVSKGNPDKIGSFADLCGKNIAVHSGTKYADDVAALSKEHCASADLPAMKVIKYGDSAGYVLLMKQGRADATATARLVADYASHMGDSELQTVPGVDFDHSDYALVFKKGSELVPAFQKALQSMIDDGTYGTIAKKWGLEQSMIKTATTGTPAS